jgi:hypothetical protein
MKASICLLVLLLDIMLYAKEPYPYPYPSSRRISLRPDVMTKCMMGDLSLDSNTIFPDEYYSNNYKKKNSWFPAECRYSQNYLFTKYLSISKDRHCDYETGKEPDLKKWIIAQPENSIDPVNIFRKAIQINEGHIFNSLLTIHQLLRNEARWRSKRYYHYSSSAKLEAQFWNKFIDIRGDLSERGEGFEGDHQGSWYRIWGIALYRLSLVEKEKLNCNEELESTSLNTFKSSMVGIAAELSKYLLDIFGGYKAGADRPGKSRVNNTGSKVGTEIINLASGLKLSEDEKNKCLKKDYIMREYNFSPHPRKVDKSGF